MAWIEKVSIEQAEGLLRRVFDAAVNRAGRVFQILHVQSQNPKTLQAGMGIYTAIMHGDSPLTRAQREMIATVVSHKNDCHY